jgi:hypothetical protein
LLSLYPWSHLTVYDNKWNHNDLTSGYQVSVAGGWPSMWIPLNEPFDRCPLASHGAALSVVTVIPVSLTIKNDTNNQTTWRSFESISIAHNKFYANRIKCNCQGKEEHPYITAMGGSLYVTGYNITLSHNSFVLSEVEITQSSRTFGYGIAAYLGIQRPYRASSTTPAYITIVVYNCSFQYSIASLGSDNEALMTGIDMTIDTPKYVARALMIDTCTFGSAMSHIFAVNRAVAMASVAVTMSNANTNGWRWSYVMISNTEWHDITLEANSPGGGGDCLVGAYFESIMGNSNDQLAFVTTILSNISIFNIRSIATASIDTCKSSINIERFDVISIDVIQHASITSSDSVAYSWWATDHRDKNSSRPRTDATLAVTDAHWSDSNGRALDLKAMEHDIIGVDAVLEHSSFAHGEVEDRRGGSVVAQKLRRLYVDDVIFDQNKGLMGASLSCVGTYSTTINRTVWTKNTGEAHVLMIDDSWFVRIDPSCDIDCDGDACFTQFGTQFTTLPSSLWKCPAGKPFTWQVKTTTRGLCELCRPGMCSLFLQLHSVLIPSLSHRYD